MLPGIDGFELMEHLKKYNIPVIFLTAKTDISSKIQGLRGGAEDYIVKPFEVLELLVRIEKVLDRAGKLDRVFHFKDIVISQDDHTVTRHDEIIPLKPMEFELLTMLVKYKNRTLPRERLLNEIWGIDYVGGTRTVDVHIAQLRKKLGLHTELVSISKIGYRLGGPMKLWLKISLICTAVLLLTVAACSALLLVNSRSSILSMTIDSTKKDLANLETSFSSMVSYYGKEDADPIVKRALIRYYFAKFADNTAVLISDDETLYSNLVFDPQTVLPRDGLDGDHYYIGTIQGRTCPGRRIQYTALLRELHHLQCTGHIGCIPEYHADDLAFWRHQYGRDTRRHAADRIPRAVCNQAIKSPGQDGPGHRRGAIRRTGDGAHRR